MPDLTNKKVAILVAEGFEQQELTEPKKALEEAGARTTIVSLKSGEIKGWSQQNWGQSLAVDMTIDEANAEELLQTFDRVMGEIL